MLKGLTVTVVLIIAVVGGVRVTPADPSPDRGVMLNFTRYITGIKMDLSLPVCQWKNITCDNATNVIGIKWSAGYIYPGVNGSLGGSFDMTKLPPMLEIFDVSGNSFSFTPQLNQLPRTLRVLRLENNYLAGPTNITNLPPGLEVLAINSNVDLTAPLTFFEHLPETLTFLNFGLTKFYGELDFSYLPIGLEVLVLPVIGAVSGSVNFTALPPMLRRLDMNSNENIGSIVDLNNMPDSLEFLDLTQCMLRGEVDFRKLPRSLTWFNIQSNSFYGSVDFSNMPKWINYFNIEGNFFSGEVDLTNAPPTTMLNGNWLSGSIDLSKLPPTTQVLELMDNNFSSSLDLTRLPPSLTMLWLTNNRFSGPVDLSKLPNKLTTVRLDKNNLTSMTSPISGNALQELFLQSNQLRGRVNLETLPAALETLYLGHNELASELVLDKLPQQFQELKVNNNNIYGKVNLTGLPMGLIEIDISDNTGITSVVVPTKEYSLPPSLLLLMKNDTRICDLNATSYIPCDSVFFPPQCVGTKVEKGIACHIQCSCKDFL